MTMSRYVSQVPEKNRRRFAFGVWRQEAYIRYLRSLERLRRAGLLRLSGIPVIALLLLVLLASTWMGARALLAFFRPEMVSGTAVSAPVSNQVNVVEAPAPVASEAGRPLSAQAAAPTISAVSVNSAPTAVLRSPAQPLSTPLPPLAAAIKGVPAGKQERRLSCEFQSASDLAWFYAVPASWQDLFLKIGHDPNGDPQQGFVGRSFDDPPGSIYPNGYGVYADPLVRALREYGLDAEAHYNEGKEWLIEQIAAGRPVMVWATYEMQPSEVTMWHTRDGVREIKAIPLEHSYIVIGYDPEGISVNDPFDGERYQYTWADFLRSWSYLDQMAIIINETRVATGQ